MLCSCRAAPLGIIWHNTSWEIHNFNSRFLWIILFLGYGLIDDTEIIYLLHKHDKFSTVTNIKGVSKEKEHGHGGGRLMRFL